MLTRLPLWAFLGYGTERTAVVRKASVGFAQQRLTLSEVAPLGLQQPAEVPHDAERVWGRRGYPQAPPSGASAAA